MSPTVETGTRPSARVLLDPRMAYAMGLGSGLLPRAPGTMGSIVALPLWYLLAPLGPLSYFGAMALLFALGVVCARHAEYRLGRKDHPGIVCDEVVGLLLACASLPQDWLWGLGGLALFRVFDIAKPWPIPWLEHRFGPGWGVMVDDLMAGLYALVLLLGIQLGGRLL